MKEIDHLIRDALREEDAELLDKLGQDESIQDRITDLFRIKPRILLVMTILFTLVALAISFYSVLRFYNAPDMREMLFWGAVTFACLAAIGAVKIWGWVEMSKNSVIREIKRLELQTAYLAGKIKRSQEPKG